MVWCNGSALAYDSNPRAGTFFLLCMFSCCYYCIIIYNCSIFKMILVYSFNDIFQKLKNLFYKSLKYNTSGVLVPPNTEMRSQVRYVFIYQLTFLHCRCVLVVVIQVTPRNYKFNSLLLLYIQYTIFDLNANVMGKIMENAM